MDSESRGIFSRRGILAEFWPIGCATLRDPHAGYLHLRNFSHALYACEEGHVSQDSLGGFPIKIESQINLLNTYILAISYFLKS